MDRRFSCSCMSETLWQCVSECHDCQIDTEHMSHSNLHCHVFICHLSALQLGCKSQWCYIQYTFWNEIYLVTRMWQFFMAVQSVNVCVLWQERCITWHSGDDWRGFFQEQLDFAFVSAQQWDFIQAFKNMMLRQV